MKKKKIKKKKNIYFKLISDVCLREKEKHICVEEKEWLTFQDLLSSRMYGI
jgi:hypothetical protein